MLSASIGDIDELFREPSLFRRLLYLAFRIKHIDDGNYHILRLRVISLTVVGRI